MRSRISGFLAGAALALGALTQPAAAIEISKHASDSATVNAIQIKGKIDDGDTFELQVYISKLNKKPTIVVYLNSPGGNLREGMRLGRFFFDNTTSHRLAHGLKEFGERSRTSGTRGCSRSSTSSSAGPDATPAFDTSCRPASG